MKSPSKCDHANLRVTYKTSTQGVRMYCQQCSACGSKVSTWIAKAKVERIWDVPPFDEELERRGQKQTQDESLEEWRVRAQQGEVERAKQSQEWWSWYNRYLLSDVWKEKRARVLVRDKNLCQACLRRAATQVHHLSYDHVGMEPLFELIAICDPCHKALHPNKGVA